MRLGDPYYDAFRRFDEIRRATRQFDEIRQMTRQFDEVRRATQPHDALRQMTQAYDEIRQATQPWDRIRELTAPAAEATRAFKALHATTDFRDSLATTQTEAIKALPDVASTLASTSDASVQKLVDAHQECRNAISKVEGIREAAEAWQARAAEYSGRDISRWTARHAASLIDTKQRIVETLGIDYNRVLGFNLEELVVPALDAYSAWGLPLNAGLLSGTQEASILIWPGVPGGSRSRTSPLTSGFLGRTAQDDCASPIVEIHCQVHCRFCGDPIIVDEEDRYLDSEDRMIISLEIVPLCPTCLRLEHEDPDYFMQQLDRLQGSGVPRSRLTLIPGAAEATSAPRGREVLRMVKTDEGVE